MTAHREYRAKLPSLNLIFGRTPEMQAVRRKLESVSNTQLPVLVQGESGTGKEMCVQLIHELSGKGAGALIKVSCPAIPHSLVETELFGYEKGAFTGATSTKRGRVEEADGGTLFLDEVGSLDLEVQSKMLQLLQDGSFMRVGGHSMRTIKTRLISVANRDLKEQVDEGSFRLDLLYRINVMTIDLPPLRRRREDIPELVDHFIEQHARTFQVTPAPLSHDAMRMMQRYDWPGNIRQLDNLIRGYVLIGNEEADHHEGAAGQWLESSEDGEVFEDELSFAAVQDPRGRVGGGVTGAPNDVAAEEGEDGCVSGDAGELGTHPVKTPCVGGGHFVVGLGLRVALARACEQNRVPTNGRTIAKRV
jgi:DNA-binding NtrC family response regulator